MSAVLGRCVALLALLWMLGFAAFVLLLPGPEDTPATDVVVVPTGSGGRIARGVEMIERHRAKRMLITGVGPHTRAAELARTNGYSARIFACCVDLGHDASDTRSNAEETLAWLRKRSAKSVRLVTTDWHMPRAWFELSRVVPPGTTIVADGVRSDPEFRVLIREYNKYVLRRIAVIAGY